MKHQTTKIEGNLSTVCSQFHVPTAMSPRQQPPVSTGQESGWERETVGRCVEGIKIQFIGRPSRNLVVVIFSCSEKREKCLIGSCDIYILVLLTRKVEMAIKCMQA